MELILLITAFVCLLATLGVLECMTRYLKNWDTHFRRDTEPFTTTKPMTMTVQYANGGKDFSSPKTAVPPKKTKKGKPWPKNKNGQLRKPVNYTGIERGATTNRYLDVVAFLEQLTLVNSPLLLHKRAITGRPNISPIHKRFLKNFPFLTYSAFRTHYVRWEKSRQWKNSAL